MGRNRELVVSAPFRKCATAGGARRVKSGVRSLRIVLSQTNCIQIGDEAVITILFYIESKGPLEFLALSTVALRTEEEVKLERHVKPREMIDWIQPGS